MTEEQPKIIAPGGQPVHMPEQNAPEQSGTPLSKLVEQPAKVEEGLAPELVEELERLSLPFESEAPSDGELRIAQAQLVGWLEGLFHGIQAALYAQQVQAQSQLHNMRLALPGPNVPKGDDSDSSGENRDSGGMYL
jgi:hypothetical protein